MVSATIQLKLIADDGKKYLTDVLDSDGIVELAKNFPNNKAMKFLNWFLYSDQTIDAKSKVKAYALFESSFIESIEVGTVKGLKQIHSYIFGGLYDFAGKVRTKNISKGGFKFAAAEFLVQTLEQIEKMGEETFEQIADKYVEMNIAHPFMEGNGRATRIWLDLMLKKNLKRCVDWSKIDKKQYLAAISTSCCCMRGNYLTRRLRGLCMEKSVIDGTMIKSLLQNALTDKIADSEMFMKGIDYSYYYEEE